MELELKRNAFHLVLGCILAVVVLTIEKEYSLYLFAFSLIIGYALSERIMQGKRVFFLEPFLDNFEREEERPGKGALHFFIGAFISLVFFPKEIVFISILILAFDDSFSTVFGQIYGRIKIKKAKTFEGFLAGFGACLVVTRFFVPLHVALIACFIAAVVELYSFLDDNITIPVSTSLIIYILTL